MIPQKTYTFDEAQKKLEFYCAYQERCHKEVHQKLKSMRMIPEAIDLIVVSLIRQDYLNESRFARIFTQGKFKIKKWGRVRITRELKYRDISEYNIKLAMKEIPEDEYINSLDELALKRFHQIKESNVFKRKKKLVDYLLYRGWESHLVYEKVNTLIK
ncbi:recombinase RecX [Flavobacteriales bacterium 34_180_T64]|nr:recombinase RecX [Flavobacteriales bacterium 34_180_T64]